MTTAPEGYDPVAWSTWNDSGYRVRSSKQHLVTSNTDEVTLCGQPLPSEGDGRVYDPDDNEGTCDKCFKAARILEDPVPLF